MLTEDQRHTIRDHFARTVQGGCADGFMRMCEDFWELYPEWEEVFAKNELEIAGIFDDDFFTCNGCEWTLPICEQDERGEWHCRDCMNEEHGDEDF